MRRPRLDTWSEHVDRASIRESRHYMLFMAVLIFAFSAIAWVTPDHAAPPKWSIWAAVGVAGVLVVACFWSWVQPLYALLIAAACMLGLFLLPIVASEDMSGFHPGSFFLLLPMLYGIRSAWRLEESRRTEADANDKTDGPNAPR